jgi:hypothetical protein
VKRIVVMALSVVLALVVAMPMALGQVGQGSKASGTASELAAAWWQWALSEPVAKNPLAGSYKGGPQCDGQPLSDTQGKRWFLAGTFSAGPVVRTCTVPVGTQLFFPVFNNIWINTEPDETAKLAHREARKFTKSMLADPEFSMSVTVDGKVVKSNRIVRAESPPGLFTVTVPKNNLFGAALRAGSYPAAADGFWAALPPLSRGKHTIHIEMSAPKEGFSQDITYHLTVVNGKPAQ